MKIVEINSCNFGSTGKIMTDIAANAGRAGHYVTVCWPASRDNAKRDYSGEKIVIGGRISRNIHLTLATIHHQQIRKFRKAAKLCILILFLQLLLLLHTMQETPCQYFTHTCIIIGS